MQNIQPDWLKDTIFYHIFPASFYDSNDDGIGDIPGITAKLDYIKANGFNGIWLSPVFKSPFRDGGYDVSDFYKVSPRYGTNADLKKLFKEAHKKGMRVFLDLVAGHTSVEHPWFQKSAQHKKNKYTNWYVWTDDTFRRIEGMDFIKGYSERQGSYLANYYYFQASLNYGFYNPDPAQPWQLPMDHPDVKAVKEELKNIMRYWLKAGCDGFRVDMAHSLVKGDPQKKGTRALWQEIRQMMDIEFPGAAIISEWSRPENSIKAGFHMDFILPQKTDVYSELFPKGPDSYFSKNGRGTIRDFIEYYMEQYKKTRRNGYICLPSSNHDICRLAYQRNRSELEPAFVFLLTMPGVPFIYYGEELGMKPGEIYNGKEGGYSRNGSRSPMIWSSAKNSGFSNAASKDLYLPVSDKKKEKTVEYQEKNPRSLLNFVRSLTALRHRESALQADGEIVPLYVEKKQYPFVYLRKQGKNNILVALNPCGKPVKASFDIPVKIKNTTELFNKGCVISNKSDKKLSLKMSGSSYGVYKLS